MKTITTKRSLGLTIKNLFKGKNHISHSIKNETSETDRPSHEERVAAFGREIQMEIKRAESMELRRLGMLSFGFLVFLTAHQPLIEQVIAFGKEVIVS